MAPAPKPEKRNFTRQNRAESAPRAILSRCLRQPRDLPARAGLGNSCSARGVSESKRSVGEEFPVAPGLFQVPPITPSRALGDLGIARAVCADLTGLNLFSDLRLRVADTQGSSSRVYARRQASGPCLKKETEER